MADAREKNIGCCSCNALQESDPAVYKVIADEYRRQIDNLELIASENYASAAVMEAASSVLTNKYAEGYPGKRYYGGCEFVDNAENIAIRRVKQVFEAEHANVQAHSGSQANMAAYFAMLEPGARILAMDLAHGGHLTHGSKVNFSGKLFDIIAYGVREQDCTIDYEAVARLARETKPALIVAGASAYPRLLHFSKFKEIADSVGARLMVDAAHIAGLVAGGVHPSPVPHADVVTMTTHKTLRGPRGGLIVCKEELGKSIDKNIFPGIQGGPLMHIIAAKAVAFGEVLRPEFKLYAQQVVNNARDLSEALLMQDFKLVSGGTDNHLMLLDLTQKGVTGRDFEAALGKAGITVNKNAIPFDTQKPTVTSGIRVGTPAVTTRGMRGDDMKHIADMMRRVFENIENENALAKIRAESLDMARSFPMFAW